MNFDQLKLEAIQQTGFKCFEDAKSHQNCWYGTSDKFADFKTLVSDKLETGTIVMLMDNSTKYMYSAYKDTWYELN